MHRRRAQVQPGALGQVGGFVAPIGANEQQGPLAHGTPQPLQHRQAFAGPVQIFQDHHHRPRLAAEDVFHRREEPRLGRGRVHILRLGHLPPDQLADIGHQHLEHAGFQVRQGGLQAQMP